MAKKLKTGNTYAIYSRCSTDDQAHQDFSTIDNQEMKNQKYITGNGGVVVKVYQDEGKTGTNLDRPGFQQMLEDAKSGCFDRICSTYMSRIARGNCFHVAEYMLTMYGVQLEFVEQVFADDFAGSMTRDMMVFIDGMQPKMVSQHTKTKMHEMVRQGYYCGGIVPFGYRSVYTRVYDPQIEEKEPPKILEIAEGEAEIILTAYNNFLEKQTIASVRDYLNVVTERQWNTTTARNMLTNEIYVGVYKWGEVRNEDHHEAIVSQDVFDQAQSILGASADKKTRSARSSNYTYYLRGLVRCPHCGCNYTNSFAKGGAVYYYECHDKKKHPKTNNCPVCRVNCDALHDAVLREIKRAAEHQTVMHKLISESGGWQVADQSLRQLRGQLGKQKGQLDLQIENLLKALADGRAYETILNKLDSLEVKRKEILAEMEQMDLQIQRSTVKRPTAAMIQGVWTDMLELWDYVTEEEKAELMGMLVREVIITEKNSVNLHLNPIADFSEFIVRNNIKSGSGERI